MSIFQFIIQSFRHYFRLHLSVILGIALSMAILLGAFIIGDSIQYNLQKITVDRLGKTNHVITAGERIFRSQLADELNNKGLHSTSILRANGIAVFNGGEARANQIQVWGIDETFNTFVDTDLLYTLEKNEIIVNNQLALTLGIKIGDELLIRVNKLSAFPSNTPLVSAEENSISFRATVKSIATAKQTGNFNLLNTQSSPKNIFISKYWLNKQLELDNKANVILISEQDLNEENILTEIQRCWMLEDINLKLRNNSKVGFSEIISERIFIEPEIERIIQLETTSNSSYFTYFVNQFRFKEKSTPYSFVSGIPEHVAQLKAKEIILNNWLANDLQMQIGDSIQLDYFTVGPLRKLENESKWFVVKKIVEIKEEWDDPMLMPEIPGLSDAGHCRDWEAGIPVDLASIREKDEDYWNIYKGTPKAFIAIKTAQELWGNRFGKTTSFRFQADEENQIVQNLLRKLPPASVGFQVLAVKKQGLTAANGGVDFGELFIGLSFFVLFAALLLAYLMLSLYLNFRKQEIRNLQALGFHSSKIRRIIFSEGILITILGILLGIPIGIAYNTIILKAINSIWSEIVQTSSLVSHLTISAILKASITIAIISLSTIWFVLRKFIRELNVSSKSKARKTTSRIQLGLFLGLLFLCCSIIIFTLLLSDSGETNTNLFFAAGFGLLPAFILLTNSLLQYKSASTKTSNSFRQFVSNRIYTNRKKVILIISFLSIGIFLVLSTGLNRKDLTSNADQASSGTGGANFYAETSFAINYDLNSDEGKDELGLDEENYQFTQFRSLAGDDASCLNLNRITRPQILGFEPSSFDQKQAFTFISKTTDLNIDHPWLSLNETLEGGLIPAIADQTVIKWGLGKTVGDTLIYKNEMGEKIALKLIGGIANSVFQGKLLISNKHFIKHFPSVSGSQVFLIEGSKDSETLKSAFRNYGLEIGPAKDRLLKFYQVENTYLNIYLQLGALGLLIGTIGLGIVIFRSLREQRAELAIMQATGFPRRRLFQIIIVEHLVIVSLALIIGALPAILSAIPSLRNNLFSGLINWGIYLALIVLISTTIWTLLAGKLILKSNLNESLRND